MRYLWLIILLISLGCNSPRQIKTEPVLRGTTFRLAKSAASECRHYLTLGDDVFFGIGRDHRGWVFIAMLGEAALFREARAFPRVLFRVKWKRTYMIGDNMILDGGQRIADWRVRY